MHRGDWNIIRFPSERVGGNRITSDMQSLLDWINSQSLVDLPLGGARFRWPNHRNPPILSRLDRFLVFRDWLDVFPEPKPTSGTALLFLIQIVKGGVPPLFRFELMWLEEKQFVDLIREWWESFSVEG